MAQIRIVPVADEGLGKSARLVNLGGGRALAVEVPRDLRAVRAAARRHNLSVAFSSEHLACLLLDGQDILRVFTGGSLPVGADARTVAIAGGGPADWALATGQPLDEAGA
jgi:hydroxyacylglutathione hydrolase